ncbi:radical SAM protein [Gammaproteobacteria bacterium]|nr:radical SAM protein [Gammaproteobacteria bacterium]
MVTSVDTSVVVNSFPATESGAAASANYPAIETATIARRVTLVRLPYANIYSVYGKLPKNREVRPPLGLLYVAGALREAGHQVTILDCEPWLYSPQRTLELVLESEPDLVGFTSTTPEIDGVGELASMIKNERPRIKTMVGGSHVSALPRQTIKDCPDIDYVIVGEGEIASVTVANHLPEDRLIRANDSSSADAYPFPARDLVDYSVYKYNWPGRGMVKMDVIESIRGCPFMCTFCSVRGVKPRLRNVKLVVDELEYSWRRNDVKLVMFFDDTLTVNSKHVELLCEEIIRRGLHKHLVFYANTRANTTKPAMLDMMIAAGFTEMSMGVETGSAEMMKAIKKGTKIEQYERVYQWMYERGLQTRASFIVGHAYETHETVLESIEFAKRIQLMRCAVNILTPYPDTHSYDQAIAGDGLHLLCADWREFKRWGTAVIRTDDLTADDLEWYQRRFLTEFYTQPKVMWYHAKLLVKGNFSLYFYRPLVFAVGNRVRDFFTRSRPPTWQNYLDRQANGETLGPIVSKLQDKKAKNGKAAAPTGKEKGTFEVDFSLNTAVKKRA